MFSQHWQPWPPALPCWHKPAELALSLLSGVRSQDWGVRIEESEIRNQDWGFRSQESGLRIEKSVFRSQESRLKSQESAELALWLLSPPPACLYQTTALLLSTEQPPTLRTMVTSPSGQMSPPVVVLGDSRLFLWVSQGHRGCLVNQLWKSRPPYLLGGTFRR